MPRWTTIEARVGADRQPLAAAVGGPDVLAHDGAPEPAEGGVAQR